MSAPLMPTMSRSAAFLACGWPWGRTDIPVFLGNQFTRYGSGFHEGAAIELERELLGTKACVDYPALAKQWEIDDFEALREHTKTALGVLLRWLRGENPYEIDFTAGLPKTRECIVIERAVAYDARRNFARFIKPVDDSHVYTDKKAGELPGTADLALNLIANKRLVKRFGKTILVIDHKTGAEVDAPGRSEQLKSLACAFCKIWGAERAIVGILHTPAWGIPMLFTDELSPADLARHRANLKLAAARVGDGSLKPGSHCARCQALTICPVYGAGLVTITRGESYIDVAEDGQAQALVKRAGTGVDLTTPEGLARAHDMLAVFDKMRDAIREQMRERVREMGPIPKANGKVLDIVCTERETLSKTSVVEAYGPVDGARLLEELRRRGAIKKSPREELREVNDR